MKSAERLFPAVRPRIADTCTVLKLLVLVLVREYREGGIRHRAMSLVYTSLLSLAPLLAVSFSVLKAFGVHNEIQPLLLEMLAPLGEKAREVTDNVIGFVGNIQVGVLGFVGFLMLFYTVVSLLEQIEDSFNHIWRVSRTRPLYRQFSDYLSIVLIGPVLLFSAIGIAASMSSMEIVRRLIALEPFGTAYYLAGIVLPYVLIVAAFAFAYSFIPNTAVKWRPALAGGLFAGLSWKATGFLFAEFTVNSAHYSAIYSGFAVILLSMIWLYLSWLILLLGSVVSFHVQFPRYLGYGGRRPHLSPQSQERLALLLMILIGRSHARGEAAACTLPGLADQVNLPWEAVADPLECLKRHGLLLSLNGERKAYVLARDTDAILLSEVVEAVRTAGDQPVLTLQDEPDAVREILAAIDRSPETTLGNRSLRDVVRMSG
ncbi:putative ribonuclease BN [Methylococcus capsulatus str. Bath]|jgi:membrane protein|uniref:Putative ribonuclease BN n=1 Tax=Methylococcus capsulatus (strain ATCC 33009 / NCIMB 11132 / Bath) TaxID=243233 RepID=Q605W7_METCA|nr:YhjD/YihY/BrkB family envelope integrity protein [Methylococcus capsulatus]AAU91626.1 putative ribonuclease BN [Methylococcus capsulatus str. Bath]UQN12236.1 YihY family inner membrane protein [Methylococcus capsulatus]